MFILLTSDTLQCLFGDLSDHDVAFLTGLPDHVKYWIGKTTLDTGQSLDSNEGQDNRRRSVPIDIQ